MADRRLYKRRFAECVAVCAAAALSLAAAYSFFALRHLSDVCEMELKVSGITRQEAEECMANVADMMDVVLWSESEAEIWKGEEKSIRSRVIAKVGDSRLLFPNAALLSDQDDEGCIISRKGALSLFGSDRAAGLKFRWGETEYTVRDVVDFPAEVIVVNLSDSEDGETMALTHLTSGIKGGRLAEKEKMFQNLAGIEGKKWDYFMMNRILGCFVILDFILLVSVFRRKVSEQPGESRGKTLLEMFFTIIIVTGCVCLAMGIATAEGWPARWSDFSQWKERMEAFCSQTEFLWLSERPSVTALKLKQFGAAYLENIMIELIILKLYRNCRNLCYNANNTFSAGKE